mmetsp:Transcript_29267/g.93355  ORF Transcript_29267/g.93355 Transcript_29267/m.93355 type:complete len:498 (-) Transcript_29267:208-1701(-)
MPSLSRAFRKASAMVNFARSGRCSSWTHCAMVLSQSAAETPRNGTIIRRVWPRPGVPASAGIGTPRRSRTSTDFLYERRMKSTPLPSSRSANAMTCIFISLPRRVEAMLILLPEYCERSFQSFMRSTICSSSLMSSSPTPTSLISALTCRPPRKTWLVSDGVWLPSPSHQTSDIEMRRLAASLTSASSFSILAFWRSTKSHHLLVLTVIVSLRPRSSNVTALPCSSGWTSCQPGGLTMGIVIWKSSKASRCVARDGRITWTRPSACLGGNAVEGSTSHLSTQTGCSSSATNGEPNWYCCIAAHCRLVAPRSVAQVLQKPSGRAATNACHIEQRMHCLRGSSPGRWRSSFAMSLAKSSLLSGPDPLARSTGQSRPSAWSSAGAEDQPPGEVQPGLSDHDIFFSPGGVNGTGVIREGTKGTVAKRVGRSVCVPRERVVLPPSDLPVTPPRMRPVWSIAGRGGSRCREERSRGALCALNLRSSTYLEVSKSPNASLFQHR